MSAPAVASSARVDFRKAVTLGDRANHLDRITILLAFLAIPLGLLGVEGAGFSLGGWAWSLVLVMGLLGFASLSVPKEVWARLTLLLAYLVIALTSLLWTPDFPKGIQTIGHYATVVVTFAAAYRAMLQDPAVLGRIRRLAIFVLPSLSVVFYNSFTRGGFSLGWIWGNGSRAMVMSLVLLFLVGTLGKCRRYVLTVGVISLVVAAATGGRMGTAVMAICLVLHPSLRLSWRIRGAIFAAGLLILIGVIWQVEAFQERFFFGEGSVEDVLTLENNFNTAGRDTNWPRVWSSCQQAGALGYGAGSTRTITLQATSGRTGHPHNEYLRLYCEVGWPGAALFWGFFGLLGIRAIRHWRRTGSELSSVSALATFALIAFSITDNITIYTSSFMAQAAVLWGLSEAAIDSAVDLREDESVDLSSWEVPV